MQTREGAATAALTSSEHDKMLLRNYTLDKDEFTQETKNIALLRDWVEVTVETKIREENCNPDKDLRSWYLNLSQAVGQDLYLARSMATMAWNEFFHATARVPKDPVAWVSNFKSVMHDATTLDLPLAKEVILWYLPLQKLTEPFLGQKLDIWRAEFSAAIKNNTLSYREIASRIRLELTSLSYLRKGTRGVKRGGAFHAGEGSSDEPSLDGEAADPLPSKKKKRKTKKPKSKEDKEPEKSASSSKTCPACGQFHLLSRCFYISKNKVPAWFHENPATRKIVDQNLASDASL